MAAMANTLPSLGNLSWKEILMHLETPCVAHLVATAKSSAKACCSDGKMVVGCLNWSKYDPIGHIMLHINLPSVKSLELGPNETEFTSLLMALAFANWQQLEQVTLRAVTRGAKQWTQFFTALQGKRITSLNLSKCKFSNNVQDLANFLKKADRIASLNLAECELQDNFAPVLGALLGHPTLKHVDLSQNSLGGECGKSIAALLSKNSSLASINVSSNRSLGDASLIFESLASNTRLRAFNFSFCVANTPAHANSIGDMLAKNTVLKSLSLVGCSITKDGGAVFRGLTNNSSLERLCFRANSLDRAATEFLILALQTNMAIEHMDLEGSTSNLSLPEVCMALAKRAKPLDLRM